MARGKRKRVLVDHTNQPAVQQPLNPYEAERAERIARNQKILEELGVQKAAAEFHAAAVPAPAPAPRRKPRAAAAPVPAACQRKSSRIQAAATADGRSSRSSSRRRAQQQQTDEQLAGELFMQELDSDHEEEGELLSQEQYLRMMGLPLDGIRVDGCFKGWVNPAIQQRYGIAGNAGEAWEANGGGAFSWKPDMSAVPAAMKAKGWSNAKAAASTMLQKNPNAYFYRHVAPHEQQAQGAWTEEEHELFLATVRQHSAGDKWGLFASYIPQRVGYQCSMYYREVAIPQGLVLDERFKLTRSGKAVYCGR